MGDDGYLEIRIISVVSKILIFILILLILAIKEMQYVFNHS